MARTLCSLPFCDLNGAPACPGVGQQCLPWYDDPDVVPPEHLDVGVCCLP